MSIADIQHGLHQAIHALPHEELHTAQALLDQSVTTLAEAARGSDDATLDDALAEWKQCREELLRISDLCKQVHKACNNYLTSIGATPTGTAALPEPAPPKPESPTRPLHPHLDEHVFRGHVRYKKFTGYHSRPGGTDTGEIQVGEPEPPDSAGCYRAPATATTRNGEVNTRTKTFFPDHWTAGEVRRAIRTAFANRRRVHYEDGTVMPNYWQGIHRGVIIEGMVFPGTDFDTATLDEVGTAYPIPGDPQKGPDHDC
ncbi:EndoU domain-containing protein [Haloactinomyces albus]|uniref:Bacterial EndoU nuclease domain-containing protein n=1 Tax=Haloactinomyces albus TaxID=1352928 RepID=A0AAE4CLC5_9ACTN|nr:EndoU domain-containing protein [Haloactinomyces albus]MDR7301674.1 hypothetical protein [Haloactinomyces albus]